MAEVGVIGLPNDDGAELFSGVEVGGVLDAVLLRSKVETEEGGIVGWPAATGSEDGGVIKEGWGKVE